MRLNYEKTLFLALCGAVENNVLKKYFIQVSGSRAKEGDSAPHLKRLFHSAQVFT